MSDRTDYKYISPRQQWGTSYFVSSRGGIFKIKANNNDAFEANLPNNTYSAGKDAMIIGEFALNLVSIVNA
jgi:hypothetical protein